MDVRARSFAERLADEFEIEIFYRTPNKLYAVVRFWRFLLRQRPALCYVLDMGFSGVLAAAAYCFHSRCRMVVDTGDSITALSWNSGRRGIAFALTRFLEAFTLRVSDRIVVRSHPHQELLGRRGIASVVVPDGVDTKQFNVSKQAGLGRELGLHGYTVIGLLGSLIWNPRAQLCYGWELLELVDQLQDLGVRGLIIGDGSGLAMLKEQCRQRGLQDRVVFLGRIPYPQLPPYLNLMDICLSTQTNDLAGQVRTTGKLPLYLACGRFVLATEVGEAARVLPAEMLVPYEGTKDLQYPARLASRVKGLLEKPQLLEQPERSVHIARTHFEYDLLAARLRRSFQEMLMSSEKGKHESFATTGTGSKPTARL